eukprot:TRINITY_DN32308_c0_g1_i1.p1 TRINITY_DN32308_c0_g1~~TRINITY_DN32308_c0_g1_i1.p1  ORF type:complete len:121 (+),score=7.74 TRINITY_DN32308_c0_g1_i1:694-1056(+)
MSKGNPGQARIGGWLVTLKGLSICKNSENFCWGVMNSPNAVPHLVSPMLRGTNGAFRKLEFADFYRPKVTFHMENYMKSHHSNREFKTLRGCSCHRSLTSLTQGIPFKNTSKQTGPKEVW